LRYLPETDCRNFVNADLIASGLSPLSPQREWLAASRLFLDEIHEYVRNEEEFSFETTLSGRSYLKLIRELPRNDWKVHLYYLWLPTVELAIERVAERVAHGGHDIPREAIVRRFSRSLFNLLEYYAPLCSSTICMDNSGPSPEVIFTQDEDGLVIEHPGLYETVVNEAKRD
jgi:predicted ABC-type ATPase